MVSTNGRRFVTDRYINPDLDAPPEPLRENTFMQLLEIAEIANFSRLEQGAYEDSLKYYRDLNNVVDTSRQEGREEGRDEGRDKVQSVSLYEY
ncbi:MAG: hypothetical protein WA949_05585 [Phormidesmis sp.]